MCETCRSYQCWHCKGYFHLDDIWGWSEKDKVGTCWRCFDLGWRTPDFSQPAA